MENAARNRALRTLGIIATVIGMMYGCAGRRATPRLFYPAALEDSLSVFFEKMTPCSPQMSTDTTAVSILFRKDSTVCFTCCVPGSIGYIDAEVIGWTEYQGQVIELAFQEGFPIARFVRIQDFRWKETPPHENGFCLVAPDRTTYKIQEDGTIHLFDETGTEYGYPSLGDMPDFISEDLGTIIQSEQIGAWVKQDGRRRRRPGTLVAGIWFDFTGKVDSVYVLSGPPGFYDDLYPEEHHFIGYYEAPDTLLAFGCSGKYDESFVSLLIDTSHLATDLSAYRQASAYYVDENAPSCAWEVLSYCLDEDGRLVLSNRRTRR